MSIDWHALGTVFGVTLVATVGLVGLFTLGIVGLTKHGSAPASGSAAESGSGSLSRGGALLARTGGYACFAVCAAAVSYGIYLIVA
ncbi:hypothetical protein [Streptomyces sp. CBMA29]|uniref:hypothetical protein n=1 Tax=Streptomyces sp. CBMA29 TaxID=1896314 RepID=UPI001661A39A|nr:hypothetical protein [Streptomyces sp. CBMA29]MBD0736508.1 hypothetical protein [Streptomyces sp. CBMA29]